MPEILLSCEGICLILTCNPFQVICTSVLPCLCNESFYMFYLHRGVTGSKAKRFYYGVNLLGDARDKVSILEKRICPVNFLQVRQFPFNSFKGLCDQWIGVGSSSDESHWAALFCLLQVLTTTPFCPQSTKIRSKGKDISYARN